MVYALQDTIYYSLLPDSEGVLKLNKIQILIFEMTVSETPLQQPGELKMYTIIRHYLLQWI